MLEINCIYTNCYDICLYCSMTMIQKIKIMEYLKENRLKKKMSFINVSVDSRYCSVGREGNLCPLMSSRRKIEILYQFVRDML